MLRSTPVSTTDIYYHTSPTRARGTLAVPRREKRWIANTPHVQNTRQECVSVHTTYFGNLLNLYLPSRRTAFGLTHQPACCSTKDSRLNEGKQVCHRRQQCCSGSPSFAHLRRAPEPSVSRNGAHRRRVSRSHRRPYRRDSFARISNRLGCLRR